MAKRRRKRYLIFGRTKKKLLFLSCGFVCGFVLGSWGCWSLSELSWGEDGVHPRHVARLIAGPTQKRETPIHIQGQFRVAS